MSIFNNKSQQLVKLIIDINNKTITVEGAEEAISKISEKDLKQFIGLVSVYPFLEDDSESLADDEMRIRVAFLVLDNYASSLNWVEHWAPGLKVQYPDIMSKSIVTEGYRGSDVEFRYRILFETDNIENYKVRNVINWFLGNAYYTSF